MAKDERKYGVIACIAILQFVSFWVSIVSSILGKICISLIASIVYAVCILVLEFYIYDNKESWKKRITRFWACEAVQLVPYALILVIRELV